MKFYLAVSALVTLLFSAHVSAEIDSNRVKANYLYQMTKFIEWPEMSANQSTILLCILEKDAFQHELQKIHLLPIKERTLHIKHVRQDTELKQCNVLYLDKTAPKNYVSSHYDFIIENHIVTIGETPSFSKDGGIITFNLKDQQLQVEINLQAAEDSKVLISANLVELATKVYRIEKS